MVSLDVQAKMSFSLERVSSIFVRDSNVSGVCNATDLTSGNSPSYHRSVQVRTFLLCYGSYGRSRSTDLDMTYDEADSQVEQVYS